MRRLSFLRRLRRFFPVDPTSRPRLSSTKTGIITRVITNKVGQDLFYEYEVDFGNQIIGIFYEAQLRLVKDAN